MLQDVDAALLLRLLTDLGSAAVAAPAAGAGLGAAAAHARVQVGAPQLHQLVEGHVLPAAGEH